jgi:outer membrane receptor protein involved in Fe transport
VDYSLAGPPTFGGTPKYGQLDQSRLVEEPYDQQFRLVSGTVTYDFDPATLTSISSYQTVRSQYAFDVSPIYVPLFGKLGRPFSAVGYPVSTGTDKVTQEMRLASRGTHVLDWLVGGFYTHEDTTNNEHLAAVTLAGLPAPNDLFTFSNPSTYQEYAAFGDLTWHLTGKFDITGGLRYAHDRQSKMQIGSGLFGSSQPQTHSSEGVVTYLGDARYHFSEQVMGYLRYATGFRPGGPNFISFNPVTHVPNGPPTFGADHLKSYEAGFKAETEDRRFGIDLAAYYIDWNNIQISVSTGNGFTGIANAPGGAKIKGSELTLTAHPITALSLSGAFAYQGASLNQADPNLGNFAGERLPNVPRFTTSVNADYVFSSSSLQPSIGASVRYVGDRYDSFDHSKGYPQFHLPEYATADVRSGLTLGPVDMQLFVHNLLDKRGELGVLTPQFGTRVAIMQPRTIGISASTHF